MMFLFVLKIKKSKDLFGFQGLQLRYPELELEIQEPSKDDTPKANER